MGVLMRRWGGGWALVSSNVLSSKATSRRLKQMITVTERSKPSVASLPMLATTRDG